MLGEAALMVGFPLLARIPLIGRDAHITQSTPDRAVGIFRGGSLQTFHDDSLPEIVYVGGNPRPAWHVDLPRRTLILPEERFYVSPKIRGQAYQSLNSVRIK